MDWNSTEYDDSSWQNAIIYSEIKVLTKARIGQGKLGSEWQVNLEPDLKTNNT